MDYLKIPEVARRLDVSEPTVRRMVKGGKLPSVFIGGAYRVSEGDLEKYLEAARVQPGDGSGKAQVPPQLGGAAELPFDASQVARDAIEEAGAETEEERYRAVDAEYVRRLAGWSREDLQELYERLNGEVLRELGNASGHGTLDELNHQEREWRESASYRRWRQANAGRYAAAVALLALDRAEFPELASA